MGLVGQMRKRSGAIMFVGLLLMTTALGYGVSNADSLIGKGNRHSASTGASTGAAVPTPAATPSPTAPAEPQATAPPAAPIKAKPTMTSGPRLFGPGDSGDRVKDLQARLKQIAWYSPLIDGKYGPATEASVRGFQAKRGIPVTGYVDQRTSDRLRAMTRVPTADELANKVPSSASTNSRLDARCLTGHTLCIDKRSRTIRYVVDGKVLKTMSVRFGSTGTPTREGQFSVGWKSRNHVSKLYDSSMPFAMFFSGGQAVHYSSDFAARGYSGASHGCVNVRDYQGIKWLYDQVNVGDKVVVYWS